MGIIKHPIGTSGFTLIEVLIMAPILMLTIVIMMSFMFNEYGQLIQSAKQLNLKSEAQTVIFGLQDDLLFSNEFSSDKNADVADAYAPSGGWTYNTNPQTLIISTPALTANRRSPNRTPVYINTAGCTPNVSADVMATNTPQFDDFIYFVSNGTLYKRVLSTPATTSTCGTDYLKQTCPAAHVSGTCPADIVVAEKVQSFTIAYLKPDNTTTTTPELSDRITVSLTLQDTAFAQTVSASTSLTMKKLNQ